jgi:hypothetical protein
MGVKRQKSEAYHSAQSSTECHQYGMGFRNMGTITADTKSVARLTTFWTNGNRIPEVEGFIFRVQITFSIPSAYEAFLFEGKSA